MHCEGKQRLISTCWPRRAQSQQRPSATWLQAGPALLHRGGGTQHSRVLTGGEHGAAQEQRRGEEACNSSHSAYSIRDPPTNDPRIIIFIVYCHLSRHASKTELKRYKNKLLHSVGVSGHALCVAIGTSI